MLVVLRHGVRNVGPALAPRSPSESAAIQAANRRGLVCDFQPLNAAWAVALAQRAVQRGFREAAPFPTHLALSADTDDLGGAAVAEVQAPRFLPL